MRSSTISRASVESLDIPLPPDLQRLSERHRLDERQDGEHSLVEIMAVMPGKSRTAVERIMIGEVEAGRWTRRHGYVNHKLGWLYREVAGGQSVRSAQADPGIHERAGRGGVFTDFESVTGGRRSARGPRKARQTRS